MIQGMLIITLLKHQVFYLALRHAIWGDCKLELIQIKFNQMQVFEERVNWSTQGLKPPRAEERTNKLNPHDASSGNRTWATLVELSALTTRPPLLSFMQSKNCHCKLTTIRLNYHLTLT